MFLQLAELFISVIAKLFRMLEKLFLYRAGFRNLGKLFFCNWQSFAGSLRSSVTG
jgi:hypothetical protein